MDGEDPQLELFRRAAFALDQLMRGISAGPPEFSTMLWDQRPHGEWPPHYDLVDDANTKLMLAARQAGYTVDQLTEVRL